jgi:two-component system, cell cycle response regulator DivK
LARVAVVEDNADNRLLLQALLGDRYDLVEFENGADALKAIGEQPVDLVLLDISLPGMDGHEVLRRIRRDLVLKALPVIAITAHAMAGDREKFLAAGFDDYITKPIVDETRLLAAMDRLLGKHSGRSGV